MQEHSKRIKRIRSLCADLDEAIRTAKDLHTTARQLQAEATALTDAIATKRRSRKRPSSDPGPVDR